METVVPSRGFGIEAGQEASDYIIRLRGELDLTSCAVLDRHIGFAERSDAKRIIIDLDALEFIDSEGLRVLWLAKRRADVDGDRLRFTRGSGYVASIFKLTTLNFTLPFLGEAPDDG